MLGAWALSLTCACSFLPRIFYLLSAQTLSRIPPCKSLPVRAKKASLFRKIKPCTEYFYDKAFAVWELPRVGCPLKCAEMLSWSKALFINLPSALKLFKSQGLLHNPTFWSWECGKVLPWFFTGFSLILNFDSFPILTRCLWLFHTTV